MCQDAIPVSRFVSTHHMMVSHEAELHEAEISAISTNHQFIERRSAGAVRATKLSSLSTADLVCPTIGPRRPVVFPIPRSKNRQLLAGLPPRGEEDTTNYSHERDSDEMKRSQRLSPILTLHFPIFPSTPDRLFSGP